jgi:hypothetical protein
MRRPLRPGTQFGELVQEKVDLGQDNLVVSPGYIGRHVLALDRPLTQYQAMTFGTTRIHVHQRVRPWVRGLLLDAPQDITGLLALRRIPGRKSTTRMKERALGMTHVSLAPGVHGIHEQGQR